jgi:hypothetical protein
MSVYDRDLQGLLTDAGDGTDMTSPTPRDTIRIGFRTVEGTRIRYAESSGPAEQSLLLTSPWPRASTRSLRVFANHYNGHQPHRALGMEAPAPPRRLHAVGTGPPSIGRRDLLGGLIHVYEIAA